jgi:PKD repeat protein
VECIIMRKLGFRTLLGVVALATTAACTVKETEAPSPTGPSALATDLSVQASPDTILWDGSSQSSVTVDARGPNNQPVRGLAIRVDMFLGALPADFGTLSARTIVTGDDGRARVVYTAPPKPLDGGDGQLLTLGFVPIGSDYSNAVRRTVDIKLIPPGVILPPNNAPVPAFTFSPSSPTTFETVYFDASTTRDEGAACGDNCSYTWSFGDGSSGSGMTVEHEFRAAGSFNVTLRVTDTRGQSAQISQTLTIAAGTPPTAVYVYSPTAPRAGQDIFFTAEASRAANGRRIVAYDWNFGSGRTGTGVTVAKRYDQPGSYVVTLTVTDDAGQQGTVSQTIAVVP